MFILQLPSEEFIVTIMILFVCLFFYDFPFIACIATRLARSDSGGCGRMYMSVNFQGHDQIWFYLVKSGCKLCQRNARHIRYEL